MSLAHTCVVLAQLISAEARQVGIPAQLALAVAHTESHCNPAARSDSGAVGLFQVLPLWKYELGGRLARRCGGTDLYDPQVNTCYGVFILHHYLRLCRHQWPCALRRYSGQSPGYVARIRQQLRRQLPPVERVV